MSRKPIVIYVVGEQWALDGPRSDLPRVVYAVHAWETEARTRLASRIELPADITPEARRDHVIGASILRSGFAVLLSPARVHRTPEGAWIAYIEDARARLRLARVQTRDAEERIACAIAGRAAWEAEGA
jgi:hypothetical protein